MLATASSPGPVTRPVPAPAQIPLRGSASPAPNGLDAASIQPRLHHHTWRERVRLSDDGFCDSPAGINLSHSLAMGLVAGAVTLSHRALAELGLGTRQAWDLAADNLVVAARCPLGTRFYLRDASNTGLIDVASTAIQVKVPGAPVTSWLAHPRTFTILNSHLENRLGPELVYLAPLPDLLIVGPARQESDPGPGPGPGPGRWLPDNLRAGVDDLRRAGEDLISPTPLAYRFGFPTPWTSAAGLPTPLAA